MKIENFYPKDVWKFFSEISSIPRGTFKEEKIMEYVEDFAKERNLEYLKDKTGNILIKKSAQNSTSETIVVLQAHSDMVWTKSADSDFNFETQGIELIVDGEFLRANNTTLGADNGIGFASILAILDNKEISHPNLECLITVAEEEGLGGANNLDIPLNAKCLINLDTSSASDITIGSAGGYDFVLEREYKEIEVPSDYMAFNLKLSNFKGGHSGVDITKKRANAIKILARLLYHLNKAYNIEVSDFISNGARNAISLKAESKILVSKEKKDDLKKTLEKLSNEIKIEFEVADPNIMISLEEIEKPKKVMEEEFKNKIINSLYSCPNGAYKFNQHSGDIEASSNIGLATAENGKIQVICFARSSFMSSMEDLASQVKASFELSGLKVIEEDKYGAWEPDYNSSLVKLADKVYEETLGKKANIYAVHAGLEVAIIDKEDKLEKISIGPDIIDAHSSTERVNIKSVENFYKLILNLLAKL